ncbi:type II toxin-antitoxin system PemK/MazF family toxin [Demequina sp.]|uniref:type II toxin-antitoxin system PemK/MazF family toxin n=1 Tax=Demequina sp. TaxID=2050685 RepID=UPI003D148C82
MKYVLLALVVLFLLGWLLSKRAPQKRGPQRKPARPSGRYPGDFKGKVIPVYSPNPNGRPDPGEIVWTWVPFEEDHSQGKDRPVLLIGRDGTWLLGLALTSKDHDNDRHNRGQWVDIGTGAWDRQRRPSEVRLDRIVRVDERAIRREGAVLPQETYNHVARSLSALHHW